MSDVEPIPVQHRRALATTLRYMALAAGFGMAVPAGVYLVDRGLYELPPQASGLGSMTPPEAVKADVSGFVRYFSRDLSALKSSGTLPGVCGDNPPTKSLPRGIYCSPQSTDGSQFFDLSDGLGPDKDRQPWIRTVDEIDIGSLIVGQTVDATNYRLTQTSWGNWTIEVDRKDQTANGSVERQSTDRYSTATRAAGAGVQLLTVPKFNQLTSQFLSVVSAAENGGYGDVGGALLASSIS